MVSKNDNKLVIWPIYFDKSKTKLNGRRIPKKYAIEKPSLEDISKALKSLNIDSIIERNCSYPKMPWKKSGRLLVEKSGSKTKLLIQIVKRI
jgi:signal recognition particle subunit SRP19